MIGLGGITGTSKRKLYEVVYKIAKMGSNDYTNYASHYLMAHNKREARYYAALEITAEHPYEKTKIVRIAEGYTRKPKHFK